jgi:hypothetical protein
MRTVWTGWSRGDGGPRAAALRPEGATQRQRAGRCSRGKNHETATLRSEGMQVQPLARSVKTHINLMTIFAEFNVGTHMRLIRLDGVRQAAGHSRSVQPDVYARGWPRCVQVRGEP